MANIEQRGKNTYRLTVELGYDSRGKRIRRRKTVKASGIREARRLAAQFRVEVEAGEYIVPEKTTFANFVYSEWLPKFAKRNYKPSTLENYMGYLTTHILPRFGDMYLDKIKTIHLVNFFDYLKTPEARKDGKKEPCSNTYILNIYNCIKSVLKCAVKWEFITRNPLDGVDRPPPAELRTDYYETDETEQIIMSLYENEPFSWRLYFLAAMIGGFRRGELVALEWPDVDFDNGTITVRKSISVTEDGQAVESDTTKNKVVRTVDMPEWYMIELKKHHHEWKKEKLALGEQWEAEDRQYVWHGGTGKPYYHSTPTNRWRKFIRRHGFRYVTLHGLRHTAATFLIEEDVHMKAIQKRLGHKKYSTTANIYSHVTKKLSRETAKKYDKFNPEKIGPQMVPK